MKYSLVYVVALCLGTTTASPLTWAEKRATTATSAQLTNFELFAGFSAAAYCTNVVDNTTTTLISCAQDGGSCDTVVAAKAFLFDSFFQLGTTDVTGYVGIDPTNKNIVVAYEGTPGFDTQALDDIEIARDQSTICGTANTNDGCKIHHGFLTSWLDSQATVTAALTLARAAYPTYKIVFTGHSLGAAIAAIGAAAMRNTGLTIDLYTYGSPRIGAQDIATYITNQAPLLGNNYRVTDFNDIVPLVPPHFELFEDDWDHYAPEYYININGTDIVPSDIDVITTPLYSTAGNSQWILITASITAHREYFGHISACN